MRRGEKRQARLNYVTVLSFRKTIVFRSMGWGCKGRDTMRGKVMTKGDELPTIIRVQVADFVFELGFG